MSNELAIFQPERFPALIDGSDLREALVTNLKGGQMTEQDLVHVPTPAGGSTRWIIPTAVGEDVVEELTGILVCFGMRGVLWPSQETTEGQLPLLMTTDLISARRVGDNYGDIDPNELEQYANGDGTYDWMALPWNQWNSGKNGMGKRCKESRIMMILREGEAFPLLVRAQPGSLKTVRPFIMRLSVPYYRAIVGLKLRQEKSKGGQAYSQIVPRLISTLDRENGDKIKKLYTDPLERMSEGVLDSDRGE